MTMLEQNYNEYEMEYLGDGQWRSIGKRDKLESVKEHSNMKPISDKYDWEKEFK